MSNEHSEGLENTDARHGGIFLLIKTIYEKTPRNCPTRSTIGLSAPLCDWRAYVPRATYDLQPNLRPLEMISYCGSGASVLASFNY